MKNIHGVYLPDHEKHLLHFAKGSGWTYQAHKLVAALEYVDKFDCAVDVGGHCGLWSMALEQLFKEVHAFEPLKDHIECFKKNTKNAVLHPFALGDVEGSCSIHTDHGSSGDSWIVGDGDIPIKVLDGFDLKPDFIKLDCEGYEYFALKGGEKTLKKYRPVVIVEQKPGRGQKFGIKEKEAVDYLESLGWKLRLEIAGDFIMTP